MAKGEIILELDIPRGKIVVGVPKDKEEEWAELKVLAEKLGYEKAVAKALSDGVVEILPKIREALEAKVNASTNGHSLTDR